MNLSNQIVDPGSRGGSRGQRGIALIEFALVTPLLLLLLAGVLDYAMALRTAMCLADAARAGARYGSQSSTNSTDIAGMQAAAVNSAPDVAGITATAARSCRCTDGSTVSCSGSCAGGMQVYVTVTAQATSPTLFYYSGLPFSGAASASAVMRAQ